MFTVAITRKPGRNFSQGITSSNLGPPDYALMLEQHTAYVETLRDLGLKVAVLEALDDFPDAYFVEDVAIVTPEVAIITNPGAPSRRGEEDTIEPVLAQFRKTARIYPPAMVEGGDVLMVGDHFFIGISERTNREGVKQLSQILESHGKTWTAMPLPTGLHLKSSVNSIGKNTLLLTEEFASLPTFESFQKIILDGGEEYAANTLLVNDCLITPKGFPLTLRKLMTLEVPIIELEVSEARKMDGGLTCMSLRF
jgi:dimethylargininase